MTRSRDLADSADKDISGTVTLDDIVLSNDMTVADNGKVIFGAGSDLQIYHDGNSKIADVGDGKLELHSNGTGVFIQKGATEYMAQFLTDGAVKLYYDNSNKLETTSAGVDISGGLVCSPNTAGKDTFQLSTNAVDEGRLRIKNVDTTTVQIRAGGDSYFNGGNLLVGKTTTNFNTAGIEARSGGTLWATADGTNAASFNRKTSDGAIAYFTKDGSTVGSIGTAGGQSYIHGVTNETGLYWGANNIYPYRSSGFSDNSIDLGQSSYRFRDLYLGGGVYIGGTGASNKLEDYEEGTWTPQIWKTSQVSMQNAIGSYIKVGDLVWLSGYVYHNSCSTSGSDNWEIRNLPFNVQHLSTAGYQFISTGYMNVGGSFRTNDHSRWQANATDRLTMYSDFSNVNCSSQAFETSFTGCLRVS